MIAKEGRKVRGALFALALVGVAGLGPALAQQISVPIGRGPGRTASKGQAAPAQGQAVAPGGIPRLELTALPVNPTDPICVVNGEVITRARLADECVARKGEEILETLVAKTLIEQALKKKKLEVTAAEVDAEIDKVAMQVAGLGREAWLRTLDKERGISPLQYARDIIYPALALRKLAADRVQVTEPDLKNAFEAQFGEKLRCRMIMVDKLQTAQEIWEDLRKNPGGFEKLAMERSMDSGSRSLGGLLAEPISRHAYPQTVSDAAFSQLVDGDPRDKDPAHKPKNGDFTGPIQVAEATWILLRREGVIEGQEVDPKNPAVRKQTYEMIYEVKLKEAMGAYMVDLMQTSEIDNKLTGKVKLANQPTDAGSEIQLMGHKPGPRATDTATARPVPSAGATAVSPSTPAALSPDVAKEAQSLSKPLKAPAPK
jgi:foldase protein PrsA